jgi:hypothetical protein
MRRKTHKRNRGQSLVEYALIAVVLVSCLILASNGVQLMMRGQVESTARGLSSEKQVPR